MKTKKIIRNKIKILIKMKNNHFEFYKTEKLKLEIIDSVP